MPGIVPKSVGKLRRTAASTGHQRLCFVICQRHATFSCFWRKFFYVGLLNSFLSSIIRNQLLCAGLQEGVDLNTHFLNCKIRLMLATDWWFNCVATVYYPKFSGLTISFYMWRNENNCSLSSTVFLQET